MEREGGVVTSQVSMMEVASIAGVTRQAVTNWRSRPASAPFPSPANVVDGVERFDLDKVLDWLQLTGRGRNVQARLDAPAVSVPDGLDLGRAVVLLALRCSIAQDLGPLSTAERVALAAEVDPDDRFLLTEVHAIASDDRTSEYVDELLAASYGPPDALARLYATRVAQGSRGLSSEVKVLLQRVAEACRLFLGPDDVSVMLDLEPRARQLAAGFAAADPDCDRAMLRHLVIDGLPVGSGTPPRVRLVALVGLDAQEVLDRVDQVAMELGAREVAIILGPASSLCDRLTGDLYRQRKETLQVGGDDFGFALAAALKLPRGYWREAHRQCLGLWVLQGATKSDGVVVADLSGRDVDAAELADDILGALERTAARAYRYGRVLAYTEVWTRDTVVLPGIGAAGGSASASGTSVLDRLIAASLVTRERIEGFDIVADQQNAAGPVARRSLGELADSGIVKVHRGSRIADEHTDSRGSIRILSADPTVPERRIDPLVEADHYSHAGRTEPGDVVFVASPRPHALVDEEGGSLVASPSRVLRVGDVRAGVGPHSLAAAINNLAESTEWRTWQIPFVPRVQLSALEDALARATDYMAGLRRREAVVAELMNHLIQGVAEGSVALGSPPTEKKAG